MQDKKQIFESLNAAIFRYCRYRLNNQADAEDCTSEVFSRWLESTTAPTDLNNLRPWLFVVARNVISEKRREIAKNSGQSHSDLEIQDDFDIESEFVNQELLSLIKQEIATLDDLTREILTLKIWEDLSFKQIAEIVEKPENTVKTTYYRSLEEIKVKLNSKSNKKMRAVGLPIIIAGIQAIGNSNKLRVSANSQTSMWQNAALQSKTLTIKESFMQNMRNWVQTHKALSLLGATAAGLIIVAAVIIFLMQQGSTGTQYGNSSTSSSQTGSVSSTSASSAPETTTFTGKYITAELPTGWTIKELEGNDGDLDFIVKQPNQAFVGLTTLEIITDKGETIFKVRPVGGVGGYGCGTVTKFNDTPQSYIDQVVAQDKGYGITTKVTDYSNTDYSEVKLISNEYRRVGSRLYLDSKPTEAGYQTACGLPASINKLPAPFGYKESDAANAPVVYDYELAQKYLEGKTEAELLKFDAILNSIAAK